MPERKVTISSLVREYFQAHPNVDMPHGPVVDFVEERYLEAKGRKPRDTWRTVRGLYQQGFLIKVRKGVYRYDPDAVHTRTLEDFTIEQKRQILERDNYRCVECGNGEREGYELHIDHIIARNRGGAATIGNGQVLCSIHNLLKKQMNQTQAGKRMFIRLYEVAKQEGNDELMRFCQDILETYERHGINGHIEWNR